MSNREYAINLIEDIPENKLIFIINILEGLKGLTNKSDEYDLQMVLDSQCDNDEEYTAEQVNQILGLDLWNIQ